VTVSFNTHALSEQDKIHLLRLARTENVGPISFFHLLKRYGDGQEALARMAEVGGSAVAATSFKPFEL